jgi:hypothetical protein
MAPVSLSRDGGLDFSRVVRVETAHCYDALGLAFSSGLGMAMEIGGMEDGHGAVTGKELRKGWGD